VKSAIPEIPATTDEARCMGEWLDQCHPLLQCSYGILAVGGTASSDVLVCSWCGGNFGDRFVIR
jgi:hypothetical protein